MVGVQDCGFSGEKPRAPTGDSSWVGCRNALLLLLEGSPVGRQYHRMLPLVGVWRDCVTRLSASRHGSRGASRLVGAARTSYRHLHRCGWSDLWCSYGATLRRAVAKVLSPRRAVEKGFQHRLAVRQKHLAEGRREIAGFVDVTKPQRSGPCEPVPQITVGIDRTQCVAPRHRTASSPA